jgi:hypothetical protein
MLCEKKKNKPGVLTESLHAVRFHRQAGAAANDRAHRRSFEGCQNWASMDLKCESIDVDLGCEKRRPKPAMGAAAAEHSRCGRLARADGGNERPDDVAVYR